MPALLRLLLLASLVLGVVYLCLSLWARDRCRARLERQWDEEIREGDRAAFVREGLAIRQGDIRRRLIWGVLVIPLALIAAAAGLAQ
ncbi:hypothetical protein [Pseudoroseicyclus aestuarii]|uniref:Uncharacterized protein n=1 Tax=Pseudoroseicyclus aestuarii TaxID=1795041 RepID=A0A318T623_9RHOB|nr:hypothetical protein [Pseudoroseicyclus aestuarii]PYE83828.1 hypothetical protein DFP88_103189 [Pseudoroseicyclus aestuarii]